MIDISHLSALAAREERAWLLAWGVTMAIGALSVLVAHGLWLWAVVSR